MYTHMYIPKYKLLSTTTTAQLTVVNSVNCFAHTPTNSNVIKTSEILYNVYTCRLAPSDRNQLNMQDEQFSLCWQY